MTPWVGRPPTSKSRLLAVRADIPVREAFNCQRSSHAEYFENCRRCMTEKEYEALYQALEAAHNILPGDKDCGAQDAELRKKIRKLEKAVLKRQRKAARAEREEK